MWTEKYGYELFVLNGEGEIKDVSVFKQIENELKRLRFYDINITYSPMIRPFSIKFKGSIDCEGIDSSTDEMMKKIDLLTKYIKKIGGLRGWVTAYCGNKKVQYIISNTGNGFIYESKMELGSSNLWDLLDGLR